MTLPEIDARLAALHRERAAIVADLYHKYDVIPLTPRLKEIEAERLQLLADRRQLEMRSTP